MPAWAAMTICSMYVTSSYRSSSFPTPNIRLEGQLPSRHVCRHGTDYDQWAGDPGRNSPPVLQRVNCSRSSYFFALLSISTLLRTFSFEFQGSRTFYPLYHSITVPSLLLVHGTLLAAHIPLFISRFTTQCLRCFMHFPVFFIS